MCWCLVAISELNRDMTKLSPSEPAKADALRELQVEDHAGEFYTSVLRRIHQELHPNAYFEIGTLHGDTLALSDCASIAVDPQFQLNCEVVDKKPCCFMFQQTSDDFFAMHDPKVFLGGAIDFAFLDGLHFFEYLLRDFMNVEAHCNAGSIVAIHDCIPTDIYIGRRSPSDSVDWKSPPHPEWWPETFGRC